MICDENSFVTPHMINVILWLREHAWLLYEEIFAYSPERDEEVDAIAWINSTRLVRALLAELTRRATSPESTGWGDDVCR